MPTETDSAATAGSDPSSDDRRSNAEIERLRILTEYERAKLDAEAKKIHSEITQNSGWHLWSRPAAWAAIIPGLAAAFTAYYAITSDFLKVEASKQEAQRAEVSAQVERQRAEEIKLQAEKVALQTEIEKERLNLEKERLDVDGKQEDLERRRAAFKTEQAEINAEMKQLESAKATLEAEVIELREKTRLAAFHIPLEKILSDEAEHSEPFDPFFGVLRDALKSEANDEGVQIVETAANRATLDRTRVLLSKTIFDAKPSDASFSKFLESFRADWTDFTNFTWGLFDDEPNTGWTRDQSERLIAELIIPLSQYVSSNSDSSLFVIEQITNISKLYFDEPYITPAQIEVVSLLIRDAFIRSNLGVYERFHAIDFLKTTIP